MPTRAIWDVSYRDVEPAAADRFPRDERAPARRHASRAAITSNGSSGNGRRSAAGGEVTATAPPGAATMTREFQPDVLAAEEALAARRPARSTRARRSATFPSPAMSPTRSIPHGSRSVRAGWRRRRPMSSFDGRTAYGERSQIPFHVTSLDWLESDRVLAGIMTGVRSADGSRRRLADRDSSTASCCSGSRNRASRARSAAGTCARGTRPGARARRRS